MPEVRYTLDRASRIATLTMDTAGPINTIGGALLAGLETAWTRAEGDGAAGVLLCSGKKRSFLDGANLHELLKGGSQWTLKSLLSHFQAILERMASSPRPVVAVVDKATALGGGFELLLWAADHVVATPGSRLGLPEVNVGLFPAGGGTHTLRRAIGLDAALEIMARGRVMAVEQLADSGLVTVTGADDAIAAAVSWIEDNPKPANRNLGNDPCNDLDAARETIAAYRRRFQVSPDKPWFKALFDSIEQGLGRDVATAAADDVDAFASLWDHPNSRNAMDFFFLSQSLGPRLVQVRDRAARPVEELAIIGAGLMGRGIAQVAADNGIEVLLLDLEQDQLEASMADLRQTLDRLVARGRWRAERRDALLARVHTTIDYDRLRGVPLVVEAVFEDLALKQRILAAVQEVEPGIVFASNTSTIPMAQIAARSNRPEQVVGMHFFSPVPLMALLEVIEGPQSSEEAVATAVTVGRRMGKTCILVGDGPGFYTSRCFGLYVLTGLIAAELGVHPQEVDRIGVAAGFPQGPLHVYGSVGGAVVYHAGAFMAEQVPFHHVPESLERLFKADYTGAGKPCFYRDPGGLDFDDTVLEHIARREGPTPNEDDVRDMLLLSMVNEAFRCREEGVLRDMASMDLGAVLGIGFPQCWHGPARYASLRGVRECRDRLAELHATYGIAQLEPCREFDRLLACGVDGGLM